MGTGTAVATGDTITAAKMNLKLETIVDADITHDSGDWTVGVDGAGQDIIYYTDTAGRVMTWDPSDSSLELDDNVIIAFGDDDDVEIYWNASNLIIMPLTDDTGAIIIGDGTNKSMDFLWYGSTAAKYVKFDLGSDKVTLEDIDLYLGDDDMLVFGDGADIVIDWTGSLWLIVPATNDTGAINIGNGSADIDLKIFLGAAGIYAEFNVGDSVLNLVGTAATILAIDSTLTGATADNAVEITVTDSQTNSSGYARGLYIAATAGGTKTGSGEHNSLGVDLTVSGDTPYAYIASLYVATSGNPTIGLVSAISIYMDDIGTGVASSHMLDLQTGNPTASAASTRETYMRIRNHGTGTPTSVMYLQANNNAKAATYLLEQDAVTKGPMEVGAFTNDVIGTDAEDGFINILVGATAAKIPFWYDD